MLKCNIDRLRNKCKVASKGQFRIIMTEVLGLIATIY